MAMPLSAADKAHLAAASSAAVRLRAGSVRRYMDTYSRWLGLNNRYWADPVKAIKHDLAVGALNHKHAAEYVAASAALHSSDGWSYLGRALQAHAAGYPDVARHLAYYAELRAAMSLLATRGVGIFDRQHFVLNSAGQTKKLAERGTHQATWLYLEEWAQSADGSRLLGKVIRPEGHPIAEWVRALPGFPAWAPLGQDWLLTLGLDLRRLSEDRAARNMASYRPTALSGTKYLQPTEAAAFILDFVGLLEPQAPGSFGELDTHFLRITLESAFRAATNNTPKQAPRQFRSAIETAVTAAQLDAPAAANLVAFLKREVVPHDPAIIAESRCEDVPPHPRHHLQVMCRAALFLRITTGAVADLLRDAGLTFAMAESWWAPLGEVRGLWDTPPTAEDIADVWFVVANGLEDIRDWRDNSATPTYRSLTDDCAQPLSRVTCLDGLALVGLAS